MDSTWKGENLIKLLQKSRHFVLNDVPDNCQVDAKILVDQNISQTCDPIPIHLGVSRPKKIRDLFCSLTEYFEIPDNRIYRFLV